MSCCPAPAHLAHESFICPAPPCCTLCPPVRHGVAVSVTDQLSQDHSACVQLTLVLLHNGPRAQSSDAGNSGRPKGSWEVLPLNET